MSEPGTKCLCVGPLRGAPGTPAAVRLTWTRSLLVFTAMCYGDSSFWHPLLLRATSEAKISIVILNHHTVGVGPACSFPPTSLVVACSVCP